MADLSHAFKGRGPGEHANTELPHNELDADIFNDIEDALQLVNLDGESLLEWARSLDFAVQFIPNQYTGASGNPITVGLVVTTADGKREPFSQVVEMQVQKVSDTTGGALINGSSGVVLVPFSNGQATITVLAPGPGVVKIGLIDPAGYGLDISDQAEVYVDQPIPPTLDSGKVANFKGDLIQVLQDLDGDGLGLIEVHHEGVLVGQRRKLNFTGSGVNLVVLDDGKVRVDITGGGGGGIVDEVFNYGAAVTLLDLVFIDAPNHVTRANAVSEVFMPGFGFVTAFPSPGQCLVRMFGKVSGFAAKLPGGLVPGALYYADPANPGLIVTPAPVGPGTGKVSQEIGVAKNVDELLITGVSLDYTVL